MSSRDLSAEARRILAETRRRDRELPADTYSPARQEHLFLRHGQERALLRALDAAGRLPLEGSEILEVGCGRGRWLRLLSTFEADEARLAGIDLDPDRCADARRRLPQADLRCGDAETLPWADDRFDVVLQSTVFTSVLDGGVRRRIAAEMQRVVSPRGAILWYDFRVDNPHNPNVRGIPRREVRRLFPGCHCRFRRVTLAPPLARRLVPLSWTLAHLLEALKILNTHDFVVIRRPA